MVFGGNWQGTAATMPDSTALSVIASDEAGRITVSVKGITIASVREQMQQLQAAGFKCMDLRNVSVPEAGVNSPAQPTPTSTTQPSAPNAG
jgi:hypothetical protein